MALQHLSSLCRTIKSRSKKTEGRKVFEKQPENVKKVRKKMKMMTPVKKNKLQLKKKMTPISLGMMTTPIPSSPSHTKNMGKQGMSKNKVQESLRLGHATVCRKIGNLTKSKIEKLASMGLNIEVASPTATNVETLNAENNLVVTRSQTKLFETSDLIGSHQGTELKKRNSSQLESLYHPGDQQADWAALAVEGLALASETPREQGVDTPKHVVEVI